METVAFYSYKGGVGRTLLVANTAQFLAISGRRVVALDLDLEAPGLHHKLGNPEVSARAASGEIRGAVDLLLGVLEGEPENLTLQEAAIEVTLPTDSTGSLLLIPAGSAPSHTYWEALERLNHSLRSGSRNGGLLEAVLELQARIEAKFTPDFLLIDSRTGITELGGMATSVLADRVVCLTTTAPESVEGTRVVAEALRSAPRLSSQHPLRINFLITRVTSRLRRSPYIDRLKEELGNSVDILPHDAGIAEVRTFTYWLLGEPVPGDDNETGKTMFTATLDWIEKTFPGHKEEADRVRRKREIIERASKLLGREVE